MSQLTAAKRKALAAEVTKLAKQVVVKKSFSDFDVWNLITARNMLKASLRVSVPDTDQDEEEDLLG